MLVGGSVTTVVVASPVDTLWDCDVLVAAVGPGEIEVVDAVEGAEATDVVCGAVLTATG